jgi:hypothetical protein
MFFFVKQVFSYAKRENELYFMESVQLKGGVIVSQEEAVKKMVGDIVNEYYPDEKLAFEVEGPLAIQDALQGKDILKGSKEPGGQFGFDNTTLETVLVFLKIIDSVVTLVKGLPQQQNKDSDAQRAEIKAKWKANLIDNRVGEYDAEQIVEKFSDELLASIPTKQ